MRNIYLIFVLISSYAWAQNPAIIGENIIKAGYEGRSLQATEQI
jgi:hypothetical protein